MKSTEICWLILIVLVGCNRTAEKQNMLEAQIAKAHADRSEVPALCRMLSEGHVFIIASWSDPKSTQITLHDFVKDSRSFIPVFSDEKHFRTESKGSGLEDKGISMDYSLLTSILRGNELLVLNPGSSTPVELRKTDLLPHAKPLQLGTRPSKNE